MVSINHRTQIVVSLSDCLIKNSNHSREQLLGSCGSMYNTFGDNSGLMGILTHGNIKRRLTVISGSGPLQLSGKNESCGSWVYQEFCILSWVNN